MTEPAEQQGSTGSTVVRRSTPEELEALPLVAPSSAGLREVVRRRYLLRMLVRNTIQSRYQGTVLGWVWSYIQPAIRFCLFYFLFQVMIGRGGDEMENFAVHLFSGMVIVHFFTETFNGGTQSLIQNRSLITKLPVPREMFPVSRMLVAAWHTVPMLLILVFVCVLLGWRPDLVGLAAAILGVLLTALLGLSLGLVFSVANVFMRDFGKVAQTLTQFVTFSVPMMYPFTMVQDRFGEPIASYYLFNPMAEAVLLIQRGFWTGTTTDPSATEAVHLPDHLFTRGLIMTGIAMVCVVLAQRLFARLESRVPERL
ncbi:ABC transporter permease [Nocardioides piscis]|uniref:Transport permease protein n=1 Tax=Nocardioides piscis TaxID=2714938 RepID=A0A6G7YG20_9ACTN|nr:ABC transporter permease [Nocardioides piscis]QIK75591.1 ABC transporter permease [Nocardioides piscis]